MELINQIPSVIQIVTFLGSVFGVFVTINNKQIKTDAKVLELETRFNRKDNYDEKLKEKVDNINDTLTELYTIIKAQKA